MYKPVVKILRISTIVDVLYANSRISVVKTLRISTIVDANRVTEPRVEVVKIELISTIVDKFSFG